MKNVNLKSAPGERLALCLTVILSSLGAMYLFLFSHHESGEAFFLAGIWQIVSFFIGSGLAGAANGIMKVDIPIYKQAAIMSFGMAFTLVLIGAFI